MKSYKEGLQEDEINTAKFFISRIKSSDVESFEEILKSHDPALEFRDNDGYTALHHAASYEQTEYDFITSLIKAGANIDARDSQGRTPIFLAALKGFINNIDLLYEAGADLEIKNNNGHSPVDIAEKRVDNTAVEPEDTKQYIKDLLEINAKVIIAINKNDYFELKNLIDEGASRNIKYNKEKRLLHFAAQSNAIMLVLLVNSGANVNLVDNNGNTPLHLVASQTQSGLNEIESMCKILLDSGADKSILNAAGKTPFDCIVPRNNHLIRQLQLDKEKSPDLIMTLEEQKDLDNVFINTCISGLKKDVQDLLSKGANINYQDEDGNSALHYAALRGDGFGIVEILIDNGANVSLTNEHGEAPVKMAYKSNNPSDQVVKTLIRKTPDIDKTDEVGNNKLHIAAKQGAAELCALLIIAEFDKDLVNHEGKTPFDLLPDRKSKLGDLLRPENVEKVFSQIKNLRANPPQPGTTKPANVASTSQRYGP